jgi:hypothetical protein
VDTVDGTGREILDFPKLQHATIRSGRITCGFVISRSPVRFRRVALSFQVLAEWPALPCMLGVAAGVANWSAAYAIFGFFSLSECFTCLCRGALRTLGKELVDPGVIHRSQPERYGGRLPWTRRRIPEFVAEEESRKWNGKPALRANLPSRPSASGEAADSTQFPRQPKLLDRVREGPSSSSSKPENGEGVRRVDSALHHRQREEASVRDGGGGG